MKESFSFVKRPKMVLWISCAVHETGVRYLDFNVADKERLIEVLKEINPDIEITEMNA